MPTRRITYRLYLSAYAVRKLHLAQKTSRLWLSALFQRGRLRDAKGVPPRAIACALLTQSYAIAKYPKFKAKRRYRGWTYSELSGWEVQTNMGVNGNLELRDLKLSIPMGRKPTICTIIWSNNKWYASITVNCVPQRPDFGCKVAIATSNGEFIESPKFQAKAAEKVKQLSKQLRRKRRPEKRKTKVSRRWRKTQSQISKVRRKVANQRQPPPLVPRVSARINKEANSQ